MKSLKCTVLTAALLLLNGLTGAGQPEESTVSLKIEASSMEQALNEFAQQTGLQLVFPAEEVTQGLAAPRVAGSFTPQAALGQLLANSGLYYRFINANTVAIRAVKEEGGERKISGVEGSAGEVRVAQGDGSSAGAGSAASGQATEEKQSTSKNSDENSGVKLEEVIVTATKRKERLQDVPMSIAAVTSEEIDRRGLVSAEDYLRGIPGVNQVGETLGESINIRGIETTGFQQNSTFGATVATYFGETPTTSSAGFAGSTNIDLKLVDIERVEVLRGPQGTTFGNSALGGAVRTIPVAPKLDRFEGKVGAGYSMTSGSGSDNQMIQAVGNIPLIEDKLAIRGVAYQFKDSGFYRNLAGSDPVFQSIAAGFGAQAFATNDDEVGSSNFTGGRIAALFQASEHLKFTLSYLTQKTEVDGWPGTTTKTYDQTRFQVAPEHVVRGQKGGVLDTDIDLANALMEYDLGWGNLLATYSYVKGETESSLAFVVFPAPLSTHTTGPHREHSGEIRLTTQLDGPWNFLGGLYAEELKDEYNLSLYWFGDPDRDFFAPGQRFLGDLFQRTNLKQKSIFGEASWEFLPAVTLTAGVRAYDYERNAAQSTASGIFGSGAAPIRGDATGTSFRGNLSYKPNDDGLVYATWSQGFRLGTPSAGLPASVCDTDSDGIVDGTDNLRIDQTKFVKSDEVDNYELGGKFTLLDRRLAIAGDIYRIDWTGVPFLVLAPPIPEGCGFTYPANAGAARSEGIEIQANVHVTDAFRVDLGGSWVDAELTKDAPALSALKGDRLPNAPKVNANLALQYEFKLGGHDAFVRADSTYVGTFYSDLAGSPQTQSGDYIKFDASARVAIRNLDIDLFVHNLTNVDDYTFRNIASLSPFAGFRTRPRTIGLQLGYSFGRTKK